MAASQRTEEQTAMYNDDSIRKKILAIQKSFQQNAYSNDEGKIIVQLLESLANGGGVKTFHEGFYNAMVKQDSVQDTQTVGFIMELLFVLFGHNPGQASDDKTAYFQKRIDHLIELLNEVPSWKSQDYVPMRYDELRQDKSQEMAMTKIGQYTAPNKRQRTNY